MSFSPRNRGDAVSDWKVELSRGDAVLADQSEMFSIADEIRSTEHAMNAQRRTLVFVRLMTADGAMYYYPLRFLDQLSKYNDLAGREQEFRLYKCPRYPDFTRRFTPVTGADIDYQNGTTRL
jgi:hypothetical protein